MELDDFMKGLEEVERTENIFSKIMHAKTVQDLLEIPAGPEELLSYFQAAEELGRREEESNHFKKIVYQRLEEACPVNKRRHAFFM